MLGSPAVPWLQEDEGIEGRMLMKQFLATGRLNVEHCNSMQVAVEAVRVRRHGMAVNATAITDVCVGVDSEDDAQRVKK